MSFRKIVSNLPFSPSLMGQLSDYDNKVRSERYSRKIGLFFVILTVIIQSIAVLQPPESANAGSSADMIARGYGPFDDCPYILSGIDCNKNIKLSSAAVNLSQGYVDASSVTAQSGDHINYTITLDNISNKTISTALQDRLADILEYSLIIDDGGGTLSEKTSILSWPTIQLPPKTKQSRTYTVRVMDNIPTTAQGADYKQSYDCIMTNYFNKQVSIAVKCPNTKFVESIASELPIIGPSANIFCSITLLIIAIFFYNRSNQLKKEIHIIRHESNMGTL